MNILELGRLPFKLTIHVFFFPIRERKQVCSLLLDIDRRVDLVWGVTLSSFPTVTTCMKFQLMGISPEKQFNHEKKSFTSRKWPIIWKSIS